MSGLEGSEVFVKVKSIIVSNMSGIDESKVTINANFTDDLGADSLDTVEVIMMLEDEFGIEIPDEDAQGMTTVKDVVEYIDQKKK